jgi:hypothetical protein
MAPEDGNSGGMSALHERILVSAHNKTGIIGPHEDGNHRLEKSCGAEESRGRQEDRRPHQPPDMKRSRMHKMLYRNPENTKADRSTGMRMEPNKKPHARSGMVLLCFVSIGLTRRVLLSIQCTAILSGEAWNTRRD